MNNYFTIKELCRSNTADRLHLSNSPSPEIREHLKELIDFINPLREAWGSPIRINSGYRSPALNKAVHGSNTSVHKIGYAVDMYPNNGDISGFKKFCAEYLKDKNFDQCLLEKSKNSEWVHLGLYNNSGQQRKQIKHLYV